MDLERNSLLKTLANERAHLEDALELISYKKISKDAVYSEQLRKEGNDLYSQEVHDAEMHQEIFSICSKSIAWAPLESQELALAYANRSVFLMHMHKYKECIKDIDRALEYITSDVLKVELLCRKIECLKKLGSMEYQNILEIAENYLSKIDKQSVTKIVELLDNVKACPVTDITNHEELDSPFVDVSFQVDKPLDGISVDNNEKYGRHLIAKKYYTPGDIIFAEKLYASVLNPRMEYTHCNYCLKVCWSGIPCNNCNWAMFCSEDCRQKGWEAFHDIECFVIPYMIEIFSNFFESMSVSLRLLLVGIREAGGIVQLKKRLESIDECTDHCRKDFYNSEVFASNTIESIYSLKSDGISSSDLEIYASGALVVLMTIVRHSMLIENFQFNQIDDIMGNENLAFLGSLLIRFTAVETNNSFSFSHKNCECVRLKSQGGERNDCCERGYCLSSLACLINHSCYPNASMCFTEDRQIIIYALQPIKKSTQIFITYAGFYYNKSLEDREKELEKYNFACDCQACIESWPPLLLLPSQTLIGSNYQLKSHLEKEVYSDCSNTFACISKKHMNFKKEDIEKVRKAIAKTANLKQPSLLVTLLIEGLGIIHSSIYGLKSPTFSFTTDCNKTSK